MINYRMNFEMEIEMLVNVEKLVVWKFEDFCEYFDVSDDREDYVGGVRIIKIELGCRGVEELVEDVDVVDGMFEVKSVKEIFEIDDYDEEFVSSEIEDWFEVDGVNMNVYGESYEEEFGYVYVRVEV